MKATHTRLNLAMLRSLGMTVLLTSSLAVAAPVAALAAVVDIITNTDISADTATTYTDGFTVNSNAALGFTSAGVLQLGSGSGTFTSGSLTIAGASGTMRAGILGGPATVGGGPGESGTVNFEAGFGNVTMTAGAGITVGVVNIGGGTFTLSGKEDALQAGSWRTGTMIDGDKSVSMSGGTLNLGDNAMLLVGYKASEMRSMNLSGGQINMNGATAGNAALLRASSAAADPTKYSQLQLSGSKISVGTADKSAYGLIASRKTDMTAGELNVSGSLIIAGALGEGADLSAALSAAGDQTGAFNLSGDAKIHLAGVGTSPDSRNHLEFYQGAGATGSMAFNQSGGQVILDGPVQNLIRTAEYKMSGGELTMSGGVPHALGGTVGDGTKDPSGTAQFSGTAKVSLDGGSLVQVKDIAISDGTFEVKGKLSTLNRPTEGIWRAGSGLEAAGKLDMSGGTVNLGSYGQMLVHYGTAGNIMTLNGEAVVNLEGDAENSAALLRASAPDLGTPIAPAAPAGQLILDGKATINVAENKYGVIAAMAMDMKGGTLNVNQGGVLEMLAQLDNSTGKAAMSSGLGKGMTINGTKLNMSGGALNVADNLTVKNQTSGAATNVGELNMSGGTAMIKGKLSVENSAVLNVGIDKSAVLSAGSIANKGTSTVGTKGVVNTSLESFMVSPDGSGTAVKDVLKVDGVLNLSYQGEAKSVTIADARTFLNSLMGTGKGTVNILDNKLVLAPDQNVGSLDDALGLGNLTAGLSVDSNTGLIESPGGNVQVKNIIVKSDENATLTVKTGSGINLVGSGSGTQLIVTQPGKSASIIAEGGSTTLGSEATNPDQSNPNQRTQGNLSGNITASNDSTINFVNIVSQLGAGAVLAESPESGIITSGGTSMVNVANASVSATRMVMADTSQAHIYNGSSVILGSLEGTPNGLLTVGNSQGAGRLSVQDTTLKGMRVFVDPAWKGTDELKPVADASQVALVFKQAGIDGLLTTGRNSLLVAGSPNTTWATEAFQKSGIIWGPNHSSAALALYGPQTMAAGAGLTVNGVLDTLPGVHGTDPSLEAVGDNLYLGKNSLLAVHVPSLTIDGTRKAALTATTASTAFIDPSAQLLLVGAAAGQDVLILENFTNPNAAASQENKTFTQENIRFDNFLLQAASNATLNTTPADPDLGKLTVKTQMRQTALDDLFNAGLSSGVGRLVKSYMTQEKPVTNAFMESALSTSAPDSTAHNVAMRMEAGLDVARAADVHGSALTAAQVGANTVLNRAGGSLAGNGLAAGSIGNVTANIWAMPLFAADSVKSAIKGSGYKVNADTTMFGGIMGGDIDLENARVGAAFSVGTGNAKAKANGVSTKNNLDYIGASLYGATTVDNVTLTAMVGFTSVKNSITQNMASGDQLKASPKAKIWNMGIRMEYDHVLPNDVHVIPSIGVDWVRYSQSSYQASMPGTGNVVSVASASNNQVSVPIGIKVNKTIALENGSTITPEARLRYIPTLGNSLNSNVSLTNVPTATATLNGAGLDNHMAELGLGLTMNLNSNLTLSAAYDFQFSKSRKGHRINALLKYSF